MVSVVILNYNGKKQLGSLLKECLRSVFGSNYSSFEVIFVDNASTDRSIEFVKETFVGETRLQIVENDQNYGFAEGNNIGISRSSGEYVALLNSDTKVDPDWLTALVNAAESPDVGAAQSRLLQMQRPEFLDCAGGLLDFYGYHFERGRGEKSNMFNEAGEIFYAKGASVLLKRTVLEKTGLFDPEVFMYFDEVDLCWRIWLSGHKVIYVPSSIVYHASGATASKMQEKARLYFYVRNHFMVLLKNYNLANAFKAIAVSFLFEIRNVFLFLIRRRPLVSASILRALIWNLVYLRRTWAKRSAVQGQVRKVSDERIKQQMLVPKPMFPLYLVSQDKRSGRIGK